jgi:putative SOS response-associated peptidase YedK
MCGRYELKADPRRWLAPMGVRNGLGDWEDRQEVFPGTDVPVVREAAGGGLEVVWMRWGFVPHWQKGKPKIRPINAKSEDAHGKPFWRDAITHRRCLLPATSFFEWAATPAGKVKHRLGFGQKPFLMAGVWDSWESEEGPQDTVAILTCPANEIVAPIHARMPVIIRAKTARAWFDHPDDAMTLPLFSASFRADPA